MNKRGGEERAHLFFAEIYEYARLKADVAGNNWGRKIYNVNEKTGGIRVI